MQKFTTIEEWIEDAKRQFNIAMDEVKSSDKKKVKIKWPSDPEQVQEVEPNLETDFEATAEN